jgi:hypothetical protein
MPVYCCFCLTADNRIVGGAHIDPADVGAAFEMAGERWRHVPRLNSIEVWAVGELLRPLMDPIAHYCEDNLAGRHTSNSICD